LAPQLASIFRLFSSYCTRLSSQPHSPTPHAMSSLKDIMDVDVEPLESQALRRSREAAAQQSLPNQVSSPATHASSLDHKDQPPLKRRRSNRVSKTSPQGSSSRPSLTRRGSSGTAESMESYGPPAGGSVQPTSGGGSSRVSSRGSNPPDSGFGVRYTPVTGRVSRAKKGQPVHVCDNCDPPRVRRLSTLCDISTD
jgi:hypothetical protein